MYPDLRSFLHHLEETGDLVRVPVEVDADQEITAIQHRVLAAAGPALLFERVRGSRHRLVSNLFGTPTRVEKAFGRVPAAVGEELAGLARQLLPPTVGSLWRSRTTLRRLLNVRLRNRSRGPVLETVCEPPDLQSLPVLTCWPEDGGPFFTLPLVHTVDPQTGEGNLGIYRLQRFDATSTGMHWQIEKGGGFHFHRACQRDEPLPISVILGGPPALTLAAIAPMPEGFDERLLAALLMGRPLDVIRRSTGHRIPATAEIVLEGTVRQGDLRREGPFGDHLGHYSHSADFPVFRVERMLARRDAVYPATVVGKPPQEDYFIGCALQEMGLPLLRMMFPGICDLWAYPETGFHPLAVASVKSRYPREALKFAMALLGHGQLSLTKVMIVLGEDVPVRRFAEVSRQVWANLDASDGLHLLAPTAQDTLDFTGPAMNTGSRLVLIATRRDGGRLRGEPPAEPPSPSQLHRQITGITRLGPAFLVVQVARSADCEAVRAALQEHPVTREYLFHILLSEDVPLDDERLLLWGWFTRFDPLQDLHPARRQVDGNRLILHFPIAIDATWKEGYRRPVAADPAVERRVIERWDSYGIRLGE